MMRQSIILFPFLYNIFNLFLLYEQKKNHTLAATMQFSFAKLLNIFGNLLKQFLHHSYTWLKIISRTFQRPSLNFKDFHSCTHEAGGM